VDLSKRTYSELQQIKFVNRSIIWRLFVKQCVRKDFHIETNTEKADVKAGRALEGLGTWSTLGNCTYPTNTSLIPSWRFNDTIPVPDCIGNLNLVHWILY
jgi:hypothetical protein